MNEKELPKLSDSEAPQNDLESLPVVEAPKPQEAAKRRRWGKWRLIALFVAVTLLGTGGAWGYVAYQAPSTVVGMAIGSLFSQPNPAYDLTLNASGGSIGVAGTLKMSLATNQAGVDVNALLQLELGAQHASANIEALTSQQGDLYLQLSDFDSALSLLSLAGIQPAQTSAISETLSRKWVKITKAELEQLAVGGSSATCIQEKIKDAKRASELRNELLNLAKAHEFLKVSKELGAKDGQLGYELAFDAAELKAYLLGFIETKTFDDFRVCVASSSTAITKADALKAVNSIQESDLSSALSGTKITIWADQWSHKLTMLKINVSETGLAPGLEISAEIEPRDAPKADFNIPTETITIKELQNQLLGAIASGS